MALTYDIHGAEAMQQSGIGRNAKLTFQILQQADAIGSSSGDYRSLGRDAAYRLGIHEQERLQEMWDNPLMTGFAKANALMLDAGGPFSNFARPLDIYVGVNKYTDIASQSLGYITMPSTLPNHDVSDLNTRIKIAENAFNFMYNAIQDPQKSSVIQNSFDRMLDSRNLYKSSTPIRLPYGLMPNNRTGG